MRIVGDNSMKALDVEFTFDPFAEMIVTRDLIKNQDASLNGQ